jgi:hypothetical protein
LSGSSGESLAKAWLKSVRMSLILHIRDDEEAKRLHTLARDKKKEADLLEFVKELLEASKIDVPLTDADISCTTELKEILAAAFLDSEGA